MRAVFLRVRVEHSASEEAGLAHKAAPMLLVKRVDVQLVAQQVGQQAQDREAGLSCKVQVVPLWRPPSLRTCAQISEHLCTQTSRQV